MYPNEPELGMPSGDVEPAPVSTRTQRLTIRPMGRADARAAAALHMAVLPGGFFPRLGPRFMAAYYASFAASPDGIALVAEVDGTLAGSLVGTVRNAAHYRWVVRHRGGVLAIRALLALACRPRVAGEFLRSRLGRYLRAVGRFSRRTRPADPSSASPGPGGPVAVLTHVAVDEAHRGLGLGGRLADRFLSEARRGPAERALLVTLDGENGAADFWRSHGWEQWGSHANADGRTVVRFRRSLR
jgi:ribosomal protein S18 acetylase RimI-like enzyme